MNKKFVFQDLYLFNNTILNNIKNLSTSKQNIEKCSKKCLNAYDTKIGDIGGSLLESRTHDQLVSKQGKYFAMWQAQQRVKNWSLNERD